MHNKFKIFSGNVPIGIPFPNVQCFILDSNLKVLPVGVPGELYIGGIGVSNGYWNRPELTNSKFLKNPFHDGIVYKTGDIARWTADGLLEFLGRSDRQVKIRGYRIEIAEVENVILEFGKINEVAVKLIETPKKDSFLCAYYISSIDFPENELHEYLSSKVLDYMIPSCFYKMDCLPYSPNGKIDIKSLPIPSIKIETDALIILPKNQIQRDLLAIWQKVLDTQSIGIQDNFFDIGGNSISILKLFNEIQEKILQRY